MHMRRLASLVALAVAASAVCFAQFQNEPDGFGGVKWGTRRADVGFAMTFLEEDEGVKLYSRTGDSLKFGDTDVVAIKYGFWQDKFYTVQVWFRGDASARAIKEYLFKEYGEGRVGTSRESGATLFGWGGYTTGLIYKYFASSKEGRVVVSSTAMLLERRGIK